MAAGQVLRQIITNHGKELLELSTPASARGRSWLPTGFDDDDDSGSHNHTQR
jgi:hypothetical protein